MSDPFCPPLTYTYDSVKLRTAFEDTFRGCAPFSDLYFEVYGANNGVDPKQVKKSELVTASSLVGQLACRTPQTTAVTPSMPDYCPEQGINFAQVSLTVASWILLAIAVHLNAKYHFAGRASSCLLRCGRFLATRSRGRHTGEDVPTPPVVTASAIMLPPDWVAAAEELELGALRRAAPIAECLPCHREREARNFVSKYEETMPTPRYDETIGGTRPGETRLATKHDETMPSTKLQPIKPNSPSASFPSIDHDGTIGDPHQDGYVDTTPFEDASTGWEKVSRFPGHFVLN